MLVVSGLRGIVQEEFIVVNVRLCNTSCKIGSYIMAVNMMCILNFGDVLDPNFPPYMVWHLAKSSYLLRGGPE